MTFPSWCNIDLEEMSELLIFVLFSEGEGIAVINTYQNPVTYPPKHAYKSWDLFTPMIILAFDTYHIRIYLKLFSHLHMCRDSNIWNNLSTPTMVEIKSSYILGPPDPTSGITLKMSLLELKPQIYYILNDLSGSELGWGVTICSY